MSIAQDHASRRRNHDLRGAVTSLHNLIFMLNNGIDLNGPMKEPLKEEIARVIKLIEKEILGY